MKQLSELQAPFRQQDLLTLHGFISYCRDNGVDIGLDDLEYYAKEGILMPAVRVIRGTIEYKRIFATFNGRDEWRHIFADDLREFRVQKVDPKSYYGVGAIHHGSNDWLDWYSERDMIRYPAQEGYIPWESFEVDRDVDETSVFGSNMQAYVGASELMYSRHQIYPLHDIMACRTITISHEALFRTSEQWASGGERISESFEKGWPDEFLRKNTVAWNNLLGLLTEIQAMVIKRSIAANKNYHEARADGSDAQDALKDAQSTMRDYDTKAKTEATGMLKKHGISANELKHWRHRVLSRGSLSAVANSKKAREYIASLNNRLLEKTEDAYLVSNQISWFLGLLGEPVIYAQQLLLGLMQETEICAFCHTPFKLRRWDQRTCGDDKCVAKWRNQAKRMKRETKRNAPQPR